MRSLYDSESEFLEDERYLAHEFSTEPEGEEVKNERYFRDELSMFLEAEE